jgi:MGT family glycosyltransferase
MSRFCFVLWAGGGNVTATLPIVERLVERGHGVTVLGDASLGRDVPHPATFRSFRHVERNDSRDPSADAIRDWQGRTPVPSIIRGYRWMFGSALRAADDVGDHVAAHPTDVVVADTMLPGALMAAEVAGLPSASLVHSVWPYPVTGAVLVPAGISRGRGRLGRLRDDALTALTRGVFQATKRPLNRQRVRLGLHPLRSAVHQFLRADRVLVLTSPSFDFVPRGLPDNAVYVGPALARATGSWRPPAASEPLVLVGLSTTYQDQRGLLERIATAIGELPVRAVITSGPIDPRELRVPSTVTVVRSIPHADVLPHVQAVVTHAGHGTTIAALAAGVPVLCMPMGRDQPGVAARAVASGAGLRLASSASVHEIRAKLAQLLQDPGYRDAAGRLAGAIAAEGDGAERAADLLEQCVSSP